MTIVPIRLLIEKEIDQIESDEAFGPLLALPWALLAQVFPS